MLEATQEVLTTHMTEYFHEVVRLAYQHQARLALNELAFRVAELVDVSKAAIGAFRSKSANGVTSPTENTAGCCNIALPH